MIGEAPAGVSFRGCRLDRSLSVGNCGAIRVCYVRQPLIMKREGRAVFAEQIVVMVAKILAEAAYESVRAFPLCQMLRAVSIEVFQRINGI